MNFLFIVHGNGNGHQTQALALYEELTKQGHAVNKCVLTGSGNTRKGNLLKDTFEDLTTIGGFEFSYKNGYLNFSSTFIKNALKFPKIVFALNQINNFITLYNPDYVISFYDVLYNLAREVYGFKTPYISIGHMYMFEDRNYGFQEYHNRFSFLKIFNRFTCLNAKKIISLSYESSSNSNLLTVGPILRESILNYKKTIKNKKIVSYFHNEHSARIIAKELNNFPSYEATIFSNTKKTIKEKNTIIRPISSTDFVKEFNDSYIFMSSCGFESTSEALFAEKKMFCIPIQNHIEQELNATHLNNKSLAYCSFNYNDLKYHIENFLNNFEPNSISLFFFKNFVEEAREKVVEEIIF